MYRDGYTEDEYQKQVRRLARQQKRKDDDAGRKSLFLIAALLCAAALCVLVWALVGA